MCRLVAAGRDPVRTLVGEVMSTELIVVDVKESYETCLRQRLRDDALGACSRGAHGPIRWTWRDVCTARTTCRWTRATASGVCAESKALATTCTEFLPSNRVACPVGKIRPSTSWNYRQNVRIVVSRFTPSG